MTRTCRRLAGTLLATLLATTLTVGPAHAHLPDLGPGASQPAAVDLAVPTTGTLHRFVDPPDTTPR